MRKSIKSLFLVVTSCFYTAALADDISGATRVVKQKIQGIEQPAEILIDHWGIAHIYAQSIRDVFFLQGYNAARDRLWQIDLWRKRGLGLLARDFGAKFIEQDRASRLFLYRGDIAQEWASYGPDAKSQATAFASGVNAFVKEIQEGKRALPVEFELADTKPDLWSAEDIVRIRSHGLSNNLISEVSRAQVACKADLKDDSLRRSLEPKWVTKIPKGLDPCIITKDVIKDYKLATAGVILDKETQTVFLDLTTDDAGLLNVGSNAWVISPQRTTTGRPILASDPHRAITVPSLRYIVHLNAPNFSVIGAGEPFLPGISIGHNGEIAFGLTYSAIDQEDLVVYERNADNTETYHYNKAWENIRVLTEKIPVKGQDPVSVDLEFTRHGPVLHKTASHIFSIRALWNEPGTAAYFGSSRYMTAQNWDSFKDALAGWKTPSSNLIYADKSGNIGWVLAAAAPLRQNWDGLLPIPGDGRYEWDGFVPTNQLPYLYNPDAGYFSTSNEMNLPKDYPIQNFKLGFEWADRSRSNRINAVLTDSKKTSLADSMALQSDNYSDMGKRLVSLLSPLTSSNPITAEGLALLKSWDFYVDRDSAAAALYETWAMRYLNKATITQVSAAADLIMENGTLNAVVNYLENPDRRIGGRPKAARDELLLSSLTSAIQDLKQQLGTDSTNWRWGQLHYASFEHALSSRTEGTLNSQLNIPAIQKSGSATTPNLSAYGPKDFKQRHGASFRMVLDVGAWDNSVAINSPGQSGNPFDPHYRDLYPLWANGDYVPLLFSRPAVAEATRTIIKIIPE